MYPTVTGLNILLLLLPGYLILVIRDSLAEKKSRSRLDKIALILLYDIFVFGFYLGILKIYPKLRPLILNIKDESVDIIGFSFTNIFIILSISLLFGVVFALFDNHNWYYKILNKLKITYKSGKYTVGNDVFYEIRGCWIIVHLENGVRIFGWAEKYSVDPDPRYLFIKDARYLGAIKEKDVEIKGPGLLITPEAKIKYIEFLNSKT